MVRKQDIGIWKGDGEAFKNDDGNRQKLKGDIERNVVIGAR